MAYGAKIICDSMSPHGVRLTTFEATFPRYIQAEVNTHKMFSRNSASSRAIPVKKMLERLEADPFYPVYWGSNKKGMQAGAELDEKDILRCKGEWRMAMDHAMTHASILRDIGLHKQDANRLLEPWMWQTALITATEWDNHWHLRNHPDAHPAYQTLARMMQEAYEKSEPETLGDGAGDWHLPLIHPDDWDWSEFSHLSGEELVKRMIKISVGRCARVSLLTHDGKRDPQADINLHDHLLTSGHMSPFEHVARVATFADSEIAMAKTSDMKLTLKTDPHDGRPGIFYVDPENQWFANFRGWVQYRKTIPGEADMLGASA